MDNSKIISLIEEVKVIIKSAFSGFSGIYFFGSRYKNTSSDDSDIDLLLAFDRDLGWKEKRELINKIYEIEIKYDYLIDAKIYNKKDIELANTPFRRDVKNNSVYYAV